MRFSEQFGITPVGDDDWFDLEATQDTPLYVDPFLVFDDNDPFWSTSRDVVTNFFVTALTYIKKAEGKKHSQAWLKAERLLTFPEPKEFALGLSMGHPEGAGTGPEFAARMANALEHLDKHGVNPPAHVDVFALFCEGLGPDRISDIFCNVLKFKFIEYTQEVSARHGVATSKLEVAHHSWSEQFGRWNNGKIALPPSPAFTGGVLLCPERFLKDIPRVEPGEFWGWASNYEFATLRDDLNYDMGESISEGVKAARGRDVAWKRPELVERYIEWIESRPLLPYDVEMDPKLLVGWVESGRQYARNLPFEVPATDTKDGFVAWVEELANEFQDAVENTDLWKALWDDNLTYHRNEKIVQAIASVMWRSQCKAQGIDISRETNMGRGAVDFKFSAGWERRALIEVKLIGSSGFFTGASKQLPQYLKSEQIDVGYYLCVGFADSDFEPDRLKQVNDTCKALSEAKGVKMKPIYVDARNDNKPSASKMKDDKKKDED